jgi:hypothetical protein
MTSAKAKRVVKPDLVITWDVPESEQRTALLLAASRDTTLGALVELLVEQWDLPVWQDEPIAYDLHTSDGKSLDLAHSLGGLAFDSGTKLHLLSAKDRLVVAQSPAGIPAFDVWHPDRETHVSVLTLPEEITVADLTAKLVAFWKLPEQEFPVYYGLQLPEGSAWVLDHRLCDLKIGDGSRLALVRQEGIPILRRERQADLRTQLGDEEWEELTRLASQAIPEEEISALARKMITGEYLEGTEEELLKVVRELWEQMLSGGLLPPSGLPSVPSSPPVSESEEIIEIRMPEEKYPGLSDRLSTNTGRMTEQVFRKRLRDAMSKGLGETEFRKLLYNLDIDESQFTGSIEDRVMGLIQYYRRRNKLNEMLCELFEVAYHVRDRLVEDGCQDWLP